MTAQTSLRFLLYDKTNQRKIVPFYFWDLFPFPQKKKKKRHRAEQTDGSSLSLHVGELIRMFST